VANRAALSAAQPDAGFNYLMFAESMCSSAFDLGPEVMPPAMFALAKDRFTKALQLAPSDDAETRNAANVGLARALHALGENPAALAAAQQFRRGSARTPRARPRRTPGATPSS
jgi:hypothetical protein